MSILLAQFTWTAGLAAMSLQLVRSSTYRKPFLFNWIITLRVSPFTFMSASTCSSLPSTS